MTSILVEIGPYSVAEERRSDGDGSIILPSHVLDNPAILFLSVGNVLTMSNAATDMGTPYRLMSAFLGESNDIQRPLSMSFREVAEMMFKKTVERSHLYDRGPLFAALGRFILDDVYVLHTVRRSTLSTDYKVLCAAGIEEELCLLDLEDADSLLEQVQELVSQSLFPEDSRNLVNEGGFTGIVVLAKEESAIGNSEWRLK
ncbi:hypothetical protein B0H13DRAFT_1859704 [Mycena leptocephala]|nr:hypothetical protein B0H13DRAFT_1859704 [Mycena leptocephala]